MARKSSPTPIGPIYQIKITLRGSHPPIWRRVLVPGRFSLYKLHQVIQLAMGWYDGHLHQFIIDGEYYQLPNPDDLERSPDERRFKLSQIAPYEKRKFVYEYDFGDSWEHELLVEKIQEAEPDTKYPCCIKGKRACPPEDVGGIWGYGAFLEALADPKHEEHDTYLEWIGGSFDPEAFSLDEVNQALRRVK
jgi:hypothetical protein